MIGGSGEAIAKPMTHAQARKHGPSVGAMAQELLDCPLPWTKVRRVYALSGLTNKYGSERVEQACAIALAVDYARTSKRERTRARWSKPQGCSATSDAGLAAVESPATSGYGSAFPELKVTLCPYRTPSSLLSSPSLSGPT